MNWTALATAVALGFILPTSILNYGESGTAYAQLPQDRTTLDKLSSPPSITTSNFLPSKPTSVEDSLLLVRAKNLTGVWNCNDGGVYFIRQVGNQLWWYGQSSDGGNTWSNVFQGTIRGNRIIGSWADVPKGSIRGYGEMTLSISRSNRLRKISGGQNFGGSVWSR